jgi:hypothetical protein
MRSARTWALVAAFLVATSCSSDAYPNASKDPDQLVAEAFGALRTARSFYVSVTFTKHGTRYTTAVHFAPSGSSGEFSKGAAEYTFRYVGGHVYVQPAPATLRRLVHGKRAAISVLRDKWLELPALSKSLLKTVDRRRFVSGLLEDAVHPSAVKGRHRRIEPDCKSGAVVKNTSPVSVCVVDPQHESVTYVAASGTPYFVGVRAAEGTMAFAEWNEPFTVQRPLKKSIFRMAG